jgi:hypothetical protein
MEGMSGTFSISKIEETEEIKDKYRDCTFLQRTLDKRGRFGTEVICHLFPEI